MLDELYPGPWAHLLIRLCGPKCDCPSPGKNPHVEGQGWQHRAMHRFEEGGDPRPHLGMLGQHLYHGGNIGLCMPPHIAALDVDTDMEGGSDWSKGFAAAAIEAICFDYPRQVSGKRVVLPNSNSPVAPGVHIFGRVWDRRPYGTHYGNVPVTIRGAGNMVVVAPSVHVSGEEYEWLIDLPNDPMKLPDFDMTLFTHRTTTRDGQVNEIERRFGEEEILWRTRYSNHWLKLLLDADQSFSEGHRHEAMLYLGWHLATTGLEEAAITENVIAFAAKRCDGTGRFAYDARAQVLLGREIEDIARDSVRAYEQRTAPAETEVSTGATLGDITMTQLESKQ